MHTVAQYLERQHVVRGWLDEQSSRVIASLSMLQRANEFSGGLGEIGVFEGRLFILLKLTADHHEECFAIDAFDDSRHGRFLENVQRWAGDQDLAMIRDSSLNISPDTIRELVGHCRLVSIDGGHDEEVVLSDIHLVEQVLTPEGVVILDDVFNERFPGVMAAVSRYLLNPRSQLKPFAVSPGKLFMATSQYVDFYREELTSGHPALFEKTEEMFSAPVAVLVPRDAPSSARRIITNVTHKTRIGRPARWVRRQLRRTGEPMVP